MNLPACPLCGARRSTVSFSLGNYDLRACQTCDLLFIEPYPSDWDSRVHAVAHNECEGVESPPTGIHYRAQVQFCRQWGSPILEQCRGARSFLDVGCGPGALLEWLQQVPGLRRVGIELNAERAAFARTKAGCEILEVPAEEFHSHETFDVIALVNVLSHITLPDQLLRQVRCLLSERGKLLIKGSEMAADVRANDIFDWGFPDHVHFLGLRTVDYICRTYGFELAHRVRQPWGASLFALTRLRMPGRSRARDFAKSVLVYVPPLRWLARMVYRLRHGTRVYSSFIVLSRRP